VLTGDRAPTPVLNTGTQHSRASFVPERKRYLLRVDPRLYTVLERWAAEDLRSVNAQIEHAAHGRRAAGGRWPPPPGPGARERPPAAGDSGRG
jgi:hypothetical protein